MKNLLLFLLIGNISFSQSKEKVQGDISTKDTAQLSILSVYSRRFPKVSVVFRAEKNNGIPVYGLGIGDMSIFENGQACEVISITELSKKKAINIGLVLDHSGSMAYDEKQLMNFDFDPLFDYGENGFPLFPKGYIQPIDAAKTAINSFVSTFDFKKDKISVIGFSSTVDKVLKLTNNEQKIKQMVNSMEADELTAFYDALYEGIKQLKNKNGLNVLVALTDGNDNMSNKNFQKVITFAKKSTIPIYIIGLGDVNTDSLKTLAEATDGQFYYANSANSLTQIYKKISVKLQAFYDLEYISPNMSSDSGEKNLEITFTKAGIHLISDEEKFTLDADVLDYLEQQEIEQEKQYYIYGGIGLLVLTAGGIFYFFSRTKKDPPLNIARMYPNPNVGNLNLIIENTTSNEGKIIIKDMNGQTVLEREVSNTAEVDVSDLRNGFYLVQAEFDRNISEAKKLLMRR
jgi:Ca-activated chloride channel family protein